MLKICKSDNTVRDTFHKYLMDFIENEHIIIKVCISYNFLLNEYFSSNTNDVFFHIYEEKKNIYQDYFLGD